MSSRILGSPPDDQEMSGGAKEAELRFHPADSLEELPPAGLVFPPLPEVRQGPSEAFDEHRRFWRKACCGRLLLYLSWGR